MSGLICVGWIIWSSLEGSESAHTHTRTHTGARGLQRSIEVHMCSIEARCLLFSKTTAASGCCPSGCPAHLMKFMINHTMVALRSRWPCKCSSFLHLYWKRVFSHSDTLEGRNLTLRIPLSFCWLCQFAGQSQTAGKSTDYLSSNMMSQNHHHPIVSHLSVC